jgi:ribosomal protein S18 acetylase RimI-like enzyme
MEIKFRTLENHPTEDLLLTFNRAFSDYLVPLQLTHLQFTTKLQSENIDLSLSVGAFQEKVLVGFILNGFRELDKKPTVYNGGTGVVPTNRGQRLTQKLYRYLIPALKQKNIQHHQLEVLKLNHPAIKSYLNSGFEIAREMNCYKGVPKNLPATTAGLTFSSFSDTDWRLFEKNWMQLPTWQNMSASLIDNTLFERVGLYINNELVAYAIFNPLTGRVFQFCVDPAYRRQNVGAHLFSFLGGKNPNGISIINVDAADTATNDFLKSQGLSHFTSLYEMKATF